MTTKAKSATGGKSPGGTPSVAYWSLLERFPLRPLGTAKELAMAIRVIDDLIDRHHLDAWEQAYLDVLSNLVSTAEEQKYPITAASDGDTFRVLCEEQGITQRDAAAAMGIANSTLSAVIHGKRRFTRGHIRRLSEYFKVPVGTFAE